MHNYRWLIALILLWLPTIASAQETPVSQPNTCPVIVRTAIDLTNERCDGTDQNQVCYGHLVLDAQPRPGLLDFGFEEPGDVVDVIEVQSLRLSALDTQTGRWGVVMMQLAATLVEEPVADSAVQILLFGDAELNDATRFLPGQVIQATNIRQQPTTASPLIASLAASTEVTANGRLPDSSWIRIHLLDTTGWIRSDLVDLRGDVDSLSILSSAALGENAPDELAQFGPMQAFYFRSGINDAPCAEAPNSGLLIQTPEGVASVSIWLDEVVVHLDATAFIQAEPDGSLTVNVLEGSAQVEAQGETRTVVAGMQVNVPLDNNLAASDVPDDPQPYDETAVQALPVELLNRPVVIPPARQLADGAPIAGNWRFSWHVDSLACPDGTIVPFESTGATSFVRATSESLEWNATRYPQTTAGVYRSSYLDGDGNLHQDTLQVVAPDRIIGEKVLDLVNPVCTLNVGFGLQLVSATNE